MTIGDTTPMTIERLWEIVKTLAESNPYSYNDNTGLMECVFCNDSHGWPPFDKVTKDHEPDCLISKARALVKEQSSNENDTHSH